MSTTGVFKVLKPIVHSMVDKNGNFRPIYIGVLKGKDPKSDNMVALKLLIQTLLNDDFLSEASKMYISDRDIKASSIAADLNERYGKSGNKKYTTKDISNRLYREQERVAKNIITSDELYDIAYNNAPIGGLVSRLTYLISKNNKVNNPLIINLPNTVMYNECDEDIFNDFLNKVKAYSKVFVDSIYRQLPEAAIGYYNYLLHNPCLSDKDKQIKEYMMHILNEVSTDSADESEEIEID